MKLITAIVKPFKLEEVQGRDGSGEVVAPEALDGRVARQKMADGNAHDGVNQRLGKRMQGNGR